MATDTSPLLIRAPGDPVAVRDGRVVTAANFTSHVNGLARRLPESGYAINVCEDGYRFLIGFGAALARGLPTLLPPNPQADTLGRIHEAWPGSFVLADRPGERGQLGVQSLESLDGGSWSVPQVPGGMLAAVLFTSGSTGSPSPQRKTWSALVEGTRVNLTRFVESTQVPVTVVATVPAQHMFGLETMVMPVLHGPVAASSGRPRYPADVLAALAAVPAPRMLVSTPVHLRALISSGLEFPPVARVLSATAPLDAALAAAVEERFGAHLVEVYGCTEAGAVASRRTARRERWRFFDGIESRPRDGSTWLAAAHLPEPVRLPDVLAFDADGSFELAGRDADLVKIGGKRGSLADVVRLLLAIPGVDDAVAFQTGEDPDSERLAALFVSASVDAERVRAVLRPALDPVFIPRPILRVGALPRSATGKLPRAALLRFYRETLAAARDGN